MMNEYELRKLLNDSELVELRINEGISCKLITKTNSKEEIKGHFEKSEHNLLFLENISADFNDWKFVVCYYAAYHAALALVASKGFASKSHDATLCLLIKYFYESGLSKEDIEMFNKFDVQDLLFYAESKYKRENAQYSTKINFETNDVNDMKLKTKLFVNKAKELCF